MHVTNDLLFWVKTMKKEFVFSFIFLTSCLICLPQASNAGAEQGKQVYQQKCVACHTIGKGRLVGPDLKGVTKLRDRAWLVRWIVEPDKMLAEGDELATKQLAEYNNVPMPNLAVTEAQAQDILAYLEAESGGEAAPKTVSAPATETANIVGDADIGKKLFLGQQLFAEGAPACNTCHRNTDIGGLGGGTLGPDLTKVHSRYGGDVGLTSVLLSMPFPTMQGIFSKKPVTKAEAAHLNTYLAKTDSQAEQPVDLVFYVIGLGLGILGFIFVNILIHLIWKQRLTGVRIPLVGR